MSVHEHLELAHKFAVSPELQVGVDPVFDDGHEFIVEPRKLAGERRILAKLG